MMRYKTSVPFTGDLASAIATARSIFGAIGFKLDQPSDTELLVIGPGMHSTRQNPILGVSQGHLTFTEESIDFIGELGGIETMKKFLYFFPLILATGLTVPFIIMAFVMPNFPKIMLLLAPLAVAPWVFLSPWIIKKMQHKTQETVETFLHNTASERPKGYSHPTRAVSQTV
jgi:hypothetical protein